MKAKGRSPPTFVQNEQKLISNRIFERISKWMNGKR